MTTISFAGTMPDASRVPSTRLRLTRRGRRVLVATAAFPAIVALTAAMVLGGGAALASLDTGAPAGSFTMVTVSAGESLWSIAERVAPTADPRDVVDGIVRLNALGGVGVTPGQQLAIPAEYAASH